MGAAEAAVGGAVQGEALVPPGNFFCPLYHILKFIYLFKSTSLVTYEGWPDVKVLDHKSPVFLIKGRGDCKAAQRIALTFPTTSLLIF